MDLTADDFDDVIRTNLRGVWLLARAEIRAMSNSKRRGAIVNTSSFFRKRHQISVPACRRRIRGGHDLLEEPVERIIEDRCSQLHGVADWTIGIGRFRMAIRWLMSMVLSLFPSINAAANSHASSSSSRQTMRSATIRGRPSNSADISPLAYKLMLLP